jgi:CHASE2 domain-containing sensor protein
MVLDSHTMNQRTPGILLGLGAIVMCLGLRAAGLLEGLELSIYDRLLRKTAGIAETRSPVFTIAIGEEEFGRYG